MCTDVDRNDKSRICRAGSVQVIGRRQIEMYSRLIHTVDHVEGYLRDGYDGYTSTAHRHAHHGHVSVVRSLDDLDRGPPPQSLALTPTPPPRRRPPTRPSRRLKLRRAPRPPRTRKKPKPRKRRKPRRSRPPRRPSSARRPIRTSVPFRTRPRGAARGGTRGGSRRSRAGTAPWPWPWA